MIIIKPTKFSKIKQIIQKLDERNLSNVSLQSLREKIDILWEGYTMTFPEYWPNFLYRAVIWRDRPTHIEQLRYPPKNKVRTFGRANFPKNSIFYGSIRQPAPFFESNAQPGDMVAVSKWLFKDRILVCHTGYCWETFDKLSSDRKCPDIIPEQFKHQREFLRQNRLIKNFFDKTFAAQGSSSYKLSAVIAEKFFSIRPNNCALAYPSIAMHANTDNYALQAACANKYLELKQAEWYRVEEYKDFAYTVTPLNVATSFDSSGKINWQISDEQQEYIYVKDGVYCIEKRS